MKTSSGSSASGSDTQVATMGAETETTFIGTKHSYISFWYAPHTSHKFDFVAFMYLMYFEKITVMKILTFIYHNCLFKSYLPNVFKS